MKKTIRILLPIILALAIVLCMAWYLFVYDRTFTRDVLLTFARYSESQGNHNVASWLYGQAYSHASDNDAVAIELAEQYKSSGNFTKAEYTLTNAISDGGGVELYIALCQTYIQQDKLLDAVNMLEGITNPDVKAQISALRPAAPTATPTPGFYSQYISVTLEAEGVIYYSPKGVYPSTADRPYSEPITLSDGENTIYAIAVSENGLVSPLSIVGYTVGGVVEKMEFKDSAIEAEIRKLLNVSDTKELYTNDLWSINSFTIPSEAKDYSALKHMPFLSSLAIHSGVGEQLSNLSALANLTELSITNTSVSQENLSIITGLPLLKSLTLQGCGITSVSAFEKATSLTALDLNNNAIRNIEMLQYLTELQTLNLESNAVSDLTPLSGLTKLDWLDVSSNSITSLAPVASLTALTWLDAGTNSISTLGELGNLTNLTKLSLQSNKLTSVATIATCKALTDLNISSNTITDISNLYKLNELMYFDFSHNQVSKIPAFSKNCALVTIDGSHNLISSLKPLGGLKNLNNVHMDYNSKISSVEPLADCPVLVEVNVYATKVTKVTCLTDQSIIVNYNPV